MQIQNKVQTLQLDRLVFYGVSLSYLTQVQIPAPLIFVYVAVENTIM